MRYAFVLVMLIAQLLIQGADLRTVHLRVAIGTHRSFLDIWLASPILSPKVFDIRASLIISTSLRHMTFSHRRHDLPRVQHIQDLRMCFRYLSLLIAKVRSFELSNYASVRTHEDDLDGFNCGEISTDSSQHHSADLAHISRHLVVNHECTSVPSM